MLASLALLPIFAASAFAQAGTATALPDSTTAAAAPACSASCFLVADIAQVIFADYTNTQTATAIASVGNGRNGTVVTTTYSAPLGSVVFNTAGVLSGQPVTGSYVQLSGTVFTLGGVALTSPTAYNVFTAYTSYTVTANAAGACDTSLVTVLNLPVASSYTIANGAPVGEVSAAEAAFYNAIGGETCVAGPASVTTNIPVSVTTTTTTSTTTSFSRPSMLPQSTAAASTTSGSSSAATSSSTSTSTSIVIITPTPIVTGAASANLPHGSTSNLLAALLAIPGIAAWLL